LYREKYQYNDPLSQLRVLRFFQKRQEIPASTRMRVDELSTSVLFPRLPLASTETEAPIRAAYSLTLWKRE